VFFQAGEEILFLRVKEVEGIETFFADIDAQGIFPGEFLKLALTVAA
jgi:hypothetical protein